MRSRCLTATASSSASGAADAAGAGGLSGPAGVAHGADGAVYVVEQYANRVRKLTADGESALSWGGEGDGAGQFDLPWGGDG